MDIALVIDMSGSIKDTGAGNWDLQMSFIKNIISNLNIGRDETRLGAVTFGNRAELHFTMDQYKYEYCNFMYLQQRSFRVHVHQVLRFPLYLGHSPINLDILYIKSKLNI